MHHQLRAAVAKRLVVGVWIAGVERKIISRLRIHLRRRNGIEPFRRLSVAFADLGSEIARPPADRIGFQQCEASGPILLPDLKLRLLLEQTNQDRRLQIHVFFGHVGHELGWYRLIRLGVGSQRDFVAIAAGKQNTAREYGRCDERAKQRAVNQCKAPPTGQFPHPKHSVHALKPMIKVLLFGHTRRKPKLESPDDPAYEWSIDLKYPCLGLIAAGIGTFTKRSRFNG